MSLRSEPSLWGARLLSLLLVLSLAGCGWHLRGSLPGLPSLDGLMVSVESALGDGRLPRELDRQLQRSGATVVPPRAGVARLRLIQETVEDVAIGGSRGDELREYDLEYRLTWELFDADGSRVAGPATIDQIRGYVVERDDLLGSESRQETLLEDLRREVAFLLVERLQSLVGE